MERKLKFFLAAIASLAFFASPAAAQYIPGGEGHGGTLPNYLFSQYTTPAGPSTATAGMYPAPHYVPGYVGNVGYTYQPLQPHEMMWQHRRNYYNYYAGPEAFYGDSCTGYGGGGLNKTRVVWQSGANHMGPLPFSTVPLAKLHYAWAQRYYCIGGNCGGYGPAGHLRGAVGSVRGAAAGVLHHGHGAGCATGNCGTGGCATGDCGTHIGQQPAQPGYENLNR